jgi:Flp pilus assembly protein TadG
MTFASKSIRNTWRRARRFALRLINDRRGVAAIEFAMIVPIMLVLFFGTVEFSSGVAADRKVSLMARTLSDLTSRSPTGSVSDTDLTNFFAASNAIMAPYVPPMYNATNGTITELWIDPATGNARVQWSKGSVPLGQGSLVTIPTDLIVKDSTGKVVPNQYLIFSQVNYVYKPAVTWGMMPDVGVTLKDVSYTRPRQTVCVIYPTPTIGALPPCPTSPTP